MGWPDPRRLEEMHQDKYPSAQPRSREVEGLKELWDEEPSMRITVKVEKPGVGEETIELDLDIYAQPHVVMKDLHDYLRAKYKDWNSIYWYRGDK